MPNELVDKLRSNWALETMAMINDLTPSIQRKASDPGWFLLRQRFEQVEADFERLSAENARLTRMMQAVAGDNVTQDGGADYERIDGLIQKLQAIRQRWGNTCVFIGKLSWGSRALWDYSDAAKYEAQTASSDHGKDGE